MFLTGLVVEEAPQARIWIVAEPLIWDDARFGRITAPIGFRTDLASVPPIVRDIPGLDPNGPSRRPAVLHDWNYSWHGLDKAHADELLRQSLLNVGVSQLLADTYYDAVHEFGLGQWNEGINGPTQQDFDTLEHYHQWLASAQPTFSTQLPGVL